MRGGAPLSAYLAAFAAMGLFSMEAALAKAIGPTIDIAQVAAIRALVQFGVLAVWLRGGFAAAWTTDRPGMHVGRGVLSATGTAAYFHVFGNMPFATATVLFFTGILFTTAGAALILRERVGWRRWSATAVGFLGAAIVVRPGAVPVDGTLAVAVFLALNAAAINLATKDLTRTETTPTIMLWIAATTLALALPFVVVTWHAPDALTLAKMVGIGLAGTVGQMLAIRAAREAEVSAIAPVLYLRIVLAGAIGALVFGEILDAPWFLGATLVAGSALYITWREARLAREGRRG
jgi:drug/metabolite transporter (DMT)-like permease